MRRQPHAAKFDDAESALGSPNDSASDLSDSESRPGQHDQSIFRNSAGSEQGSNLDEEDDGKGASFVKGGSDSFEAALEQDANIRERLGQYADLVAELTHPSIYETQNEVVDVLLSHDATRLVLLEQCN